MHQTPTSEGPKRRSYFDLERVATIIAAALGVISFVWQIGEHIGEKRETVYALPVGWSVEKDSIRLIVDVVNRSDRSVYVRGLEAAAGKSNFGLILGHDTAVVTPIEPGAAVRFVSGPFDRESLIRVSQQASPAFRIITTRRVHESPAPTFYFSLAADGMEGTTSRLPFTSGQGSVIP